MKVFAVLVRSILSYISNQKPKLKCIKHVYVYTFLNLACDLIIYDNPSQVKLFFDLLRIRSSQVIFSSKISQVKSSQVTCDLTWLDSSQKLTWLAHVWPTPSPTPTPSVYDRIVPYTVTEIYDRNTITCVTVKYGRIVNVYGRLRQYTELVTVDLGRCCALSRFLLQ
jgi:hypothetical protein